MKILKKILLEIVNWTWCLPQNLVGLIVCLITRGKPAKWLIDGRVYKVYNIKLKIGSASLGKYILLCESHQNDPSVVLHEYGHYYQNLLLGPLTLLVIFLPSLLWAGIFHDLSGKEYDWFYTERWATNWGNKY